MRSSPSLLWVMSRVVRSRVAPIWPSIQATPPKDPGNKIYLTAWTHLMTCTAFDEGAFGRFVDDYRGPSGDAPEKFPLDSLAPGGQ